jgi:hypothetical protein
MRRTLVVAAEAIGKALVSLKVFPHRKFETVEEFRAACPKVKFLPQNAIIVNLLITKTEFSPELPWFETIRALLDSGYQGICSDFVGEHIKIAHKKPRKSKKNSETTLTPEQKAENKELSSTRIFVENAIAGLKRFNILVHDFRNRRDDMDDDVIAICAGL